MEFPFFISKALNTDSKKFSVINGSDLIYITPTTVPARYTQYSAGFRAPASNSNISGSQPIQDIIDELGAASSKVSGFADRTEGTETPPDNNFV